MGEFQYGEILKQSWEKTKANYGMLFLVLIVYYIISIVFGYVSESFEKQGSTGMSLLISLISTFVNIFVSIGLIRCLLQAADDQKVKFATLFSGGDVFLNFFVAQLAYGLLVLLGYLLLIVPGIIWSIKYSFVPYCVVDKNMGIKESFSTSGKITDGYKWKIFCLMFLAGLINIGGMLCLGVGLLVTIPWTCVVYPVVFRLLMGETVAVQGDSVDDNSDIQTFNNWQ